eukprot:m51a1_g2357 putative rna recognition motif domain containing protein (275) ;mRNA; r:605986-607226
MQPQAAFLPSEWRRETARPPERESRVLFVRNIEFATPLWQLRELFGAFGQLKHLYDLVSRRGICFVTYYDIRSAREAKERLDNGREDESEVARGFLQVVLRGLYRPPDDLAGAVRSSLASRGDIRTFCSVPIPGPVSRDAYYAVEYFDTRAAECAIATLHDREEQWASGWRRWHISWSRPELVEWVEEHRLHLGLGPSFREEEAAQDPRAVKVEADVAGVPVPEYVPPERMQTQAFAQWYQGMVMQQQQQRAPVAWWGVFMGAPSQQLFPPQPR